MAGVRLDVIGKDKTGRTFENVKQKVDGLNSKFAGLKKSVGAFAPALAAAFGGAFLSNAAQAADRIDKLSKRLGVSVTTLSQYQLAAGQAGLDLEKVGKSMQQLAKNAVQASKGTNEQRAALSALGIDVGSFLQLPIDQQFARVADGIAGIENPAQRVSVAMALMGDEGAAMLQMMGEGSAGLVAMQQKADALGITLNKTETDAIATMNDAFGNLGLQAVALGQHFLAQLAPAITFVAKALQVVLAGAITLVRTGFRDMVQVLLNWMGNLMNGFGGIVGWMEALPGKAGAAAAEMSKSLKGYGELLTSVTSDTSDITFATDEFNITLDDNSALIAQLEQRLPKLGKAYEKTGKDVKKTTDEVKTGFDGLGQNIQTTLEGSAREALGSLTRMGEGFDGLRGIADRALQQISQSILDNLINTMFQPQLPWLAGGGGAGGFLGSAGSFLSGMFGGFFAEGGTLKPGQWGIVGEQGAEAVYAGSSPMSVVPLQGGSSQTGSTQIVYNIDARGAEAGVEQRIIQALRAVDRSIESRAVLAVANARQRTPKLV